MASLFQSLRWVHITAGSIALILFWIPAITRKGGRTHTRVGWFYVACMSVVVVTAFAMSGLAFTIPVAVRQITRRLSPAELSDFLRSQRVFATFLAYLAGVTLASGWQGIWAIETKRQPKNDAHALQSGPQRGGTRRWPNRARPRNQISQRPADWSESYWSLGWSGKFALLAAWSANAYALVVRTSWLDDWHGNRRLHRLLSVRWRAAVSFGRPKPAVHNFLGTAKRNRRAGHLRNDGLLPAQIQRDPARTRSFLTDFIGGFLNPNSRLASGNLYGGLPQLRTDLLINSDGREFSLTGTDTLW
jgi:hypothetical protein